MGRNGGGGGASRVASRASRSDHSATSKAKKKAAADQGVKFTPQAGLGRGHVTVVVDVQKFDASLAANKTFHVGPGGTGAAIEGRYEQFKGFLDRARAAGVKIEQPRGGLDASGFARIGDGRHRFAVFRDSGAKTIPISVPRADAAKVREKFGPSSSDR